MTAPALTILVPLYNEADNLPELTRRLLAVMDTLPVPAELLLVDDGSTDGSWPWLISMAATEPRLHLVQLSRNWGQQRALLAGLHLARGSQAVCMLDADLQEPPELVADFWQQMAQGGYDVVYGIRRRRKEGLAKRTAFALYYRLLRASSEHPTHPDSGDFALLSRRVVAAILAVQDQRPYLRGLRAWVGYRQLGVPYERQARHAGSSKYTLARYFQLALDGFFGHSQAPARIIGWGAGLLGVASILGLGLAWPMAQPGLLGRMQPAPPPGMAVLLAVAGLGTSLVLGAVAIVAAYLARILEQTRHRPPYLVVAQVVGGQAVSQ